MSETRPGTEVVDAWLDGIRRHVNDLRSGTFEGRAGKDREASYREAFDFLTPVAQAVLTTINETLLAGSGQVSVQPPEPDGRGGLIGSWTLTWPLLRQAVNRISGGHLRPVMIGAVFPAGFVHPHLVAGGPVDTRSDSLVAWPMQVVTAAAAATYEPLLWAIASAEVHDRIYQSSWAIIPGA